MTKRPDGALEREVMTVLWEADRPLQAREINTRMSSDLAYTSVATVLGRLQTKGLVTRSPSGRAFAYEASVSESELAVRRITEVLSSASDRTSVLASFAGSLSKKEAKSLRALLENGGP